MPVVVSYTTVSLMTQTLVEIGSISTLTSSIMLIHASAAEAYINAKISKRYSLSFAEQVPLLEMVATDLAIYRILTGRIVIKEEHPWFARYKDAMRIVDEIADGKLPLATSSGNVVTGRSDEASGMEAWSNTMGYHPTHWEGPWTLHTPDEDKIDDEADARDIDMLGGKLS